jgi:hypothetical protein
MQYIKLPFFVFFFGRNNFLALILNSSTYLISLKVNYRVSLPQKTNGKVTSVT